MTLWPLLGRKELGGLGDGPLDRMTEGDQPIETHDAEQRQTRRALAALVTFVLALAAIGAAAASWQLHKAEYDDSQANLRRFARAVTEQTAWDLHQIDTVLQLTSTWLARSDQLEASGTARLQERVQPRLTALPSVQSIIVSNQEGTLRMVTRDSFALPTTGFDPRPLYRIFPRSSRCRPDRRRAVPAGRQPGLGLSDQPPDRHRQRQADRRRHAGGRCAGAGRALPPGAADPRSPRRAAAQRRHADDRCCRPRQHDPHRLPQRRCAQFRRRGRPRQLADRRRSREHRLSPAGVGFPAGDRGVAAAVGGDREDPHRADRDLGRDRRRRLRPRADRRGARPPHPAEPGQAAPAARLRHPRARFRRRDGVRPGCKRAPHQLQCRGGEARLSAERDPGARSLRASGPARGAGAGRGDSAPRPRRGRSRGLRMPSADAGGRAAPDPLVDHQFAGRRRPA